jgi:hypothetical protein
MTKGGCEVVPTFKDRLIANTSNECSMSVDFE